MAAREIYAVDVPFASGTKKIAYNANALAAAERELGCKVLGLLGGDFATTSQRVGFIEIRALLWAGLRAVRGRGGGPEWDLDRVGDEMIVARFTDYMLAIIRAVNLALSGREDPPPTEDPTTETAPTGSTGTVSE